MVRLKASSCAAVVVVSIISIPYGSIKSAIDIWGANSPDISIPYGSIKRLSESRYNQTPLYFNSLWFD